MPLWCRSQHPCKRYFISVTEEEISQALFWLHQAKVKDRVHVFERTFTEIKHLDPKTDKLKDFIDIVNEKIAQDSVNRLRDLRRRLGEASHLNEHTTRYPPLEWKDGGIDPSDSKHAEYLREFLDNLCGRLLKSLDQAEAKLAVEAEPLADECRLHLWFAKVRAVKYAATPSSEAALLQVKKYLNGPSGGKPLVVYGPSGSGKTYVMAKAVAEEAERVSTPSPTGSRERGRIWHECLCGIVTFSTSSYIFTESDLAQALQTPFVTFFTDLVESRRAQARAV
jgi:DNA replication protein DnaC